MKVENGSVFFITVVWVCVVLIAVILAHYEYHLGTIAATTIAIIATYIWMKNKIINPLKKISTQLFEINLTNSLSKRILLQSNLNEINAITNGINTILSTAEMMKEKREEELNHKLEELQLFNQELKRELSELRPIANRPITQIIATDYDTQEETAYELPNRFYFNQILSKSFHHAQRHQNILAILLIDVCQFSKISSTYGEESAKKLLLELGKRIEKTLRSDDVIAKLENDEFIILLNNIEKPQFASIVAGKLLQSISQLIKLNNENENIIPSANIGICIYPGDGNSLEELLTHLDTALYKAKSVGENTYQFYGQATNHSAHEYFQIESALHHSIINNELVLYYQPKLNIKKGCVVSLEALLRWINPNMGIMYPAQFITIADETRFFLPMTEWVIREACKMNKYWQDEGYSRITVSVNLSSKQFSHPELPNILSRALEDHKLNPKYLEIELDETTIMEDVNTSSNTLLAIKAIGVRVAIDHFGVGHTSISYLKKFPISTIKIDKSFIKGIPNSPDDSAIVSAFIALSHQLGIVVVAEGVETAEQVQFLAEQQCDIIQGYFLSHPLPADKIKSQLSKVSEEVLI